MFYFSFYTFFHSGYSKTYMETTVPKKEKKRKKERKKERRKERKSERKKLMSKNVLFFVSISQVLFIRKFVYSACIMESNYLNRKRKMSRGGQPCRTNINLESATSNYKRLDESAGQQDLT